MLNSSMNYPYPVLRSAPIDFKKSTFSADITKRDCQNGYELSIEYYVNNAEIESMISKRMLVFALQVQCISTWYRALFTSDSKRGKFFLPSERVHERVDLCPCIVAMETISKFENSDFSEDFNGIAFSLNKGEPVAIGERQKFDAIYKDDIIKKGDPIVHFKNDESCSLMFCEWEFDTIQIHLPKDQYKKYNDIGLNEPWKIPMLNAVYVVPVIVQAINEINSDENGNGSRGMESWAWYKTLKVLIQRAAKDDLRTYKRMLQDPIKTAQILLNDNSSQALEIVSKASRS